MPTPRSPQHRKIQNIASAFPATHASLPEGAPGRTLRKNVRARPGAPLYELQALDLHFRLRHLKSIKRSARKRGPASKLQRHIERISALPKAQQRFVVQMLDTVLQQQGG